MLRGDTTGAADQVSTGSSTGTGIPQLVMVNAMSDKIYYVNFTIK